MSWRARCRRNSPKLSARRWWWTTGPARQAASAPKLAVRAPADGYTIMMVSTSYTGNAALYKLPYDPLNDIVPIVMIGEIGNMVTVNRVGAIQ